MRPFHLHLGLQRRMIVPEVVQTSAMDCGPAALKCLMEGFRIPVSYGRLREACQTDIDGTSIDTLEEVAVQLGLDATQVMLPADHVLLATASVLPAIAIVRMPHGDTHFLVLWRRHGRYVQVMDPAIERRWTTSDRILNDLYIHEMPVPADAWQEWAASDGFLIPLRYRMKRLGLPATIIDDQLNEVLDEATWCPLAALDAAVRMTDVLVRSQALDRGDQASRALETLYHRAYDTAWDETPSVPAIHWSVRPAVSGPEGEPQVLMRGAVLIQVTGAPSIKAGDSEREGNDPSASTLNSELAAALEEPPSRPGRTLWRLMRTDGVLTPLVTTAALALAAGGVLVEALLLRGLIDIGRELGLSGQRMGAMGGLLIFILALLGLEWIINHGLLRGGRRLEVRLRQAFLEKIPRLGDRYFRSRPISDMAERSHSIHRIRYLLALGGQGLQLGFELILTTLGMIWLAPSSAPMAVMAAILAIGIPILVQPVLAERDLRIRTHNGALSRFYLDTLLGLVSIRTHGAGPAIRREQTHLLGEWAQASRGLHQVVTLSEGLQWLTGFTFAAALLLHHHVYSGGSMVLLLVYWALKIPALGQDIAILARQYPAQHNITLRLLEPLGALDEHAEEIADRPETRAIFSAEDPLGVGIKMIGVQVQRAGHPVLDQINLTIAPGSHVAIVDTSGAGKSSLVGALLGWHTPTAGQIEIDGCPLMGKTLDTLRRQTAWIDPAVQLWNQSLYDNLAYGMSEPPQRDLGQVIRQADLHRVLESLPDGLQTPLGENGARLSGGESQRVRFGRALQRPDVRLVILDEPFRGLDREHRRRLLARAREVWSQATLLCITHDVSETQAFNRVLVIEEGHIAEDGAPGDLMAQPETHYRSFVEAELAVRTGLWSDGNWRHPQLINGQLHSAAETRQEEEQDERIACSHLAV